MSYWQPHERDFLVKVWGTWDEHGKVSGPRIGLALGRSKNSVIGEANRLGLPRQIATPHPLTDEERARRVRVRHNSPRRPAPIPMGVPTLVPLVSVKDEATVSFEPSPPPEAEPVVEPELSDHPCCWPFGDPGERGFRFCDAPTQPGKSYCPSHMALAHQPKRRTPGW